MIHKCIHGDNGVTDIKEHKTLIYSAGRDGRVLLYSIKDNFLHLLHAIKVNKNFLYRNENYYIINLIIVKKKLFLKLGFFSYKTE